MIEHIYGDLSDWWPVISPPAPPSPASTRGLRRRLTSGPPRHPGADQERSRRFFYKAYFGFGAQPPRRYDDGFLMLYDAHGFALALGPADEPVVRQC